MDTHITVIRRQVNLGSYPVLYCGNSNFVVFWSRIFFLMYGTPYIAITLFFQYYSHRKAVYLLFDSHSIQVYLSSFNLIFISYTWTYQFWVWEDYLYWSILICSSFAYFNSLKRANINSYFCKRLLLLNYDHFWSISFGVLLLSS